MVTKVSSAAAIPQTVYRPGDCVVVKSEGNELPFVGKIWKIRRVKGAPAHDYEMDVTWFYRPEEALGRKAFHGKQELFRSDHKDRIHASTVEHKCNVMGLGAYQSLEKRTEVDFYTRLKYDPQTEEFLPTELPIYCVCGLPYNPDRFMVECDVCSEWFHPECLDQASRDRIHMEIGEESFLCSACVPIDSSPSPSSSSSPSLSSSLSPSRSPGQPEE